MIESGQSKEAKEATKGTETLNGTQVQKVEEEGIGSETMIVAQPLRRLRSLLGIRCHLIPLPITPCPERKTSSFR